MHGIANRGSYLAMSDGLFDPVLRNLSPAWEIRWGGGSQPGSEPEHRHSCFVISGRISRAKGTNPLCPVAPGDAVTLGKSLAGSMGCTKWGTLGSLGGFDLGPRRVPHLAVTHRDKH